LIEALIAIIEAAISLIVGIVEAVVALFVEGASGLGGAELILLLIVLFIEAIWWFLLILIELIRALFKLKRPRKIPRPIIWRPKNKNKKEDSDNEDT